MPNRCSISTCASAKGTGAALAWPLVRAAAAFLNEMASFASAGVSGANAVVGVDLDYEVLGEKNGMLMVSASGTAVVVE
jgi:uncharacterized protein YbjQ (UPF0145 family)